MKKLLLIILVTLFFWINASMVLAVDPAPVPHPAPKIPKPQYMIGPEDTSDPQSAWGYIMSYIGILTQQLLGMLVVLAVIMLVISGIMYVVAFGEEEKIKTAKQMMTYVVIGLLIAMFSYTIVSILNTMALPKEAPAAASSETPSTETP